MLTTISGIPCRVEVTHYHRQKANDQADNPDDYHGYVEVEFDVLDRRGRPAPWLEKKLSADDNRRIEAELLTELEPERHHFHH